jgi:IS5 family transposase
VRVLSRVLRRAKRVAGVALALPPAVFRTRTRSVRRLTQQLHRLARRKGEGAAEELTQAYGRLLDLTRKTCTQAARVTAALRGGRAALGVAGERLVAQFDHFLPLVARTIDQTVRRVLQGEVVPAKAKVVSLFEPHTQIIQRHKPGKPVEFGRKLWLDEVDGGIVSRYALLDEPGPDHPHLPDSLAGHRARFGRPPEVLAGDRGTFSPANERLAQQAGVRHVALPCAGRASPTRQRRERERWFRRGFRFRAGIEGRISVLQRCYGLDRCPDHGEDGMARYIGWGIVAHNLAKIAQTQAARTARATT